MADSGCPRRRFRNLNFRLLDARRLMAEIATRVEMEIGHDLGKVAPDTRAVMAAERGLGNIIARCREWGLPDPQWQVEDGDDFVMVMPRTLDDIPIQK